MNENINLVEILKDAPKGTKLWSPLCGECELIGITLDPYPIKVSTEGDYLSSFNFLSDGRYADYPDAECLLFPSKEHRNWSTFKVPQKHRHFELEQKVLVPYHDGDIYKWRLTFYSHYDESIKLHVTTDTMCFLDEEVIAYKGNENKLGKPIE